MTKLIISPKTDCGNNFGDDVQLMPSTTARSIFAITIVKHSTLNIGTSDEVRFIVADL